MGFNHLVVFTMKIAISQLPESEVEITGELTAEEFEIYRGAVMKEFVAKAELPGFRKGHAPANLVEQKAGEEKILFEMAEHALSEKYPRILEENKIDAVGRPEISITKIARNNPLGFSIKTAVMPEIKLADYNKIAKQEMAKETEPIRVEEKELDEVVAEARKSKVKKPTGTETSQLSNSEKPESDQEEEPRLDDDFAKSLGDFKSLADLREKIKQNLEANKRQRAKEQKRLRMMDEIIKAAEINLPKILVAGELNKMAFEMKHQIDSLGLKYEDYLKHLKKTEEDLRKDWQAEAVKRAKFGLIIDKIATLEKITADPAELKREVEHILAHYKDADPARARAYAENLLINENVFQFLENQK